MRLIAVLGYSDRHTHFLHPVCAARLARAETEVRPGDSVLLSGWARRRTSPPEADLMARAWTSPVGRVILDRNARSTVGNILGVARAARRTGAQEVVVVTSGWHGRRASALARAALIRTRTKVTLVTTDDSATRRTRLRELACWTLVPFFVVVAARTR
ncbi:MAG: YdcF family protein [Gaiellaceae bacterium]